MDAPRPFVIPEEDILDGRPHPVDNESTTETRESALEWLLEVKFIKKSPSETSVPEVGNCGLCGASGPTFSHCQPCARKYNGSGHMYVILPFMTTEDYVLNPVVMRTTLMAAADGGGTTTTTTERSLELPFHYSEDKGTTQEYHFWPILPATLDYIDERAGEQRKDDARICRMLLTFLNMHEWAHAKHYACLWLESNSLSMTDFRPITFREGLAINEDDAT